MNKVCARLFCILLAMGLSLSTRAASVMPAAESATFVADLDWLAEQLPKRHANLYHSTPKAQFDDAFASLRERLPQLSRTAAMIEFARLLGLARDGHTALFLLPFPGGQPIKGVRQMPVQLYAFDDGMRVIAIDKAQERWIGAKVSAIGGVPMDDAIQRVLPLLPRDNPLGEREYSAWYLSLFEVLEALGLAANGEVEFSVIDDAGKAATLTLLPMSIAPDAAWATRLVTLPGPREAWVGAGEHRPIPKWLARANESWWLEKLADGSIYAQINQLRQTSETPFASFIDQLSATLPNANSKLIIDLRLNRGGDGELRWPLIHALLRHPGLQTPGSVRVLTSRRTFSAAQLLANDLERHLRAIFIGEPTGSSPNHYGEFNLVNLPNSGLPVLISSLYWQHHPRDQRPWIAPHQAVALTYADLAAGRDAILDAAQQFVAPPSISAIMQPHLKDQRTADALAAFRAVETRYHNPYRNLFEKELNDIGYGLIGEQRHADAVAVLKVATELYPDSWNAWDSLGEAYALLGVRHRAAHAYARSFHLNPANNHGADMLQKLLQRR